MAYGVPKQSAKVIKDALSKSVQKFDFGRAGKI
jgi:hypothetical protein